MIIPSPPLNLLHHPNHPLRNSLNPLKLPNLPTALLQQALHLPLLILNLYKLLLQYIDLFKNFGLLADCVLFDFFAFLFFEGELFLELGDVGLDVCWDVGELIAGGDRGIVC